MQDQPLGIIHTPVLDFGYYFTQITDLFVSHLPLLMTGTKGLIGILITISIFVSVIFIICIVYAVERLKYIRRKEDEVLNRKVDMGFEEVEKANSVILNKWNGVTTKIESDNESDWRQAIIEADIILGDILTTEGYKGEGIGEQLRRVDKADFHTLDQAWEAHKIRNLIAHEGSSHPLNKYEARRIINLYHQVFKEFYDF